jgi:hypothetical protein
VASNTTAYLSATANSGLATTVDTLTSIENVTGSTGTDYIVGSAGANNLKGNDGADTIIGGEGDDSITGGAGADVLTGGLGADGFVYTRVGQGGNVATVGTTVIGAGDVITDFVSGTDDLDYSSTVTGTDVVTAAASAINLNTAGVVLVNTTLDFTAGTTDWTAVAAALNTAGISSFTAAAGTVAYFAVLDDNGNDPDQYNVFEVTTGALVNAALVVTAETVSLVSTVTATLVAGDFFIG